MIRLRCVHGVCHLVWEMQVEQEEDGGQRVR